MLRYLDSWNIYKIHISCRAMTILWTMHVTSAGKRVKYILSHQLPNMMLLLVSVQTVHVIQPVTSYFVGHYNNSIMSTGGR